MLQRILLIDRPTVLPLKLSRLQPPLWAAYLSSYLQGIVEYLDARVEEDATWIQGENWWTWGLAISELSERIIAVHPDMIGIHVGVSTELDLAESLVHNLKKKSSARIVMGGPGIATIPSQFLPPEITQVEICRTVGFGKSLGLENISKSADINAIPNRDIWWHQYQGEYEKVNNFHSGPPLVNPSLQIETSIGCGADCQFCATQSQLLVRRSPASVQLELVDLRSKGVKGLHIEDDNFLGFVPKQVAEAIPILVLAVTAGFEAIEFPNGLTIKGMLAPLFLEWLQGALEKGVKLKLSLPFESASDEILKAVYKPHRRKDCDLLLEKLLPLLQQGLKAEVFLQVGFVIVKDGGIHLEGEETIAATLAYAQELASLGIEVNVWFNSTIPGTPSFPLWRKSFPNASWESLLFSLPSLFYPVTVRDELRQRAAKANTAPRSAAFSPQKGEIICS